VTHTGTWTISVLSTIVEVGNFTSLNLQGMLYRALASGTTSHIGYVRCQAASGNKIGAEGAKALGPLLAMLRNMTALNLRSA